MSLIGRCAFQCRRCVERGGKDWEGSDPVCGFSAEGDFQVVNWNCATLNALRDLVVPGALTPGVTAGVVLWQDDFNVGVLPRPEPPEGGHAGFVLLRWYKHRGRTDDALVWPLHELPRSMTLSEAEAILG